MPEREPVQLRFEFTRQYREVYVMSRRSIEIAAQIMLALIDETGQASWLEIAKRRMGITGDSVPQDLVMEVAEQVECVAAEHGRIKDVAQEQSGRHLRVVDRFLRSALRGSGAYAVVDALSPPGQADEHVQGQMGFARMFAHFERQYRAGIYRGDHVERLVALGRETHLAPTEHPVNEVIEG